MSKLRQAMTDAMEVRGFAVRTHRSYLNAVEGLANYYNCSPHQLSAPHCATFTGYRITKVVTRAQI